MIQVEIKTETDATVINDAGSKVEFIGVIPSPVATLTLEQATLDRIVLGDLQLSAAFCAGIAVLDGDLSVGVWLESAVKSAFARNLQEEE